MCQENKRFSANLMLKSWKGGTFTNAPEKQPSDHAKLPYELTPKSVVYSTDLSKVTTLATVIKEKGGQRWEDLLCFLPVLKIESYGQQGVGFLAGATSVYGYESFAADACGSALKQKSGKPVFLTTSEVEIRKCMEACKAAASVHMLWSFTFAATQQQLQPKGLVLMSKKVVNVPAG